MLTSQTVSLTSHHRVSVLLRAALELLKPVTWFPPMWAFTCGVVSVGGPSTGQGWMLALGVLVAGPMACGGSQIVNDWFDRDVDAINEPKRPIPSGRMPGQWGLVYAVAWSLLTIAVATPLGVRGTFAVALGVVLAWAYSAPPVRLKANGWLGNLAVGLSYEGLAWLTGAVVALDGRLPAWPVLAVLVLYSVGAHGIMTLNDFKSVDGDRVMGVRSLPVQLGLRGAAWSVAITMITAQMCVLAVLLYVGVHWGFVAGVSALVLVQHQMMRRFIATPDAAEAFRMSAFGVPVYVSGMMVSAVGLRLAGAA